MNGCGQPKEGLMGKPGEIFPINSDESNDSMEFMSPTVLCGS
jgi:hypothetical protein